MRRTTLQSKVAIGFGLAGLALVFILVVQIRYITGLLSDAAQVERTHEVKRHFDRVFTLIKDLERGQRGFLVSGQEDYLDTYYAAEADIPREFSTLENLIEDADQQRRLQAVEQLIQQERSFSNETIRLMREGKNAAAVELFQTGIGRQIVMQVRVLSAEIDQVELSLLAQRSANEKRRAKWALSATAGGIVLNFLVFSFLLYLIRREIRQRDTAEKALLESEARRLYLVEHARDEAVQSARLKAEFLANMSHEIRTPMNGIVGMTSLLVDTKLDDEQHHFVDSIRLSADALLRIINDILDFSKLEARKVQLEALDFELGPFIEGIAQVFVRAAETKNIELTSIIEPEVPAFLHADSTRLRQVLINLLGNAVKFTEHGEVTLRVRLQKSTRSGAVCRFQVTDTGIGISEEAQQRLFRPFVQADGTTTRRFGGSGLGLTISKHLVEAMGGEIGVQSRPGEGSTFWFNLPAQKTGETNVQADPRTHLEGLGALIVDDKAIHREALRKQLAAWRIDVAEADGFNSALNRLRAAVAGGRPFDLALIDHDLDGREGLDLARDIRNTRELAGVRLILLSTFAQRPSEEVLKEAGVRAVLTKPVRQSVFYDCLVTVMKEHFPSTGDLNKQPARGDVESSVRTKASTGSGVRLLVVEDNPVNQVVARFQVTKLGYSVDVANDGAEALSMLDTYDYALVLMDCHMPVMDGFEATRRIRERSVGKRRVPIIAVTASGTRGEREKCLETGMDDFLLKPFRKEELSEKIEQWIAGRSSATEAGDGPAVTNLGLQQLEQDYGKEMLSRIVRMFIPDAERLIGQIEEAIEHNDCKSLEESAHRLKSGAANIGANEMSKLSAELETCGETRSLVNAEQLLNSLQHEWDRVKPQITSYD